MSDCHRLRILIRSARIETTKLMAGKTSMSDRAAGCGSASR
jgi:hypothetical protein